MWVVLVLLVISVETQVLLRVILDPASSQVYQVMEIILMVCELR